MTLNPEQRHQMVLLEFDRAWKMIHEAEINLKNELWNVVGNRIYYAVFHGVSGLLINNGLKVGTHKGASVVFANNFIRTGVFDKEFGALYGKLQSIREKADYNNTYELEPQKALLYFDKAKIFISIIQEYCNL